MKVPTPSSGGRTLLVQLGGVFFDKTQAEGPSAAPVRFCFWHTVRIDSSCIECGPHRKRCATETWSPLQAGCHQCMYSTLWLRTADPHVVDVPFSLGSQQCENDIGPLHRRPGDF